LGAGAVVGTSALRRRAQLLHRRPDLKIVNLRGNVDTRLRKREAGEVEATLLALAGLKRLGLEHVGTPVPEDEVLPAVGQGAICIECRADDAQTRAWLAAIDHGPTATCVAGLRDRMEDLSDRYGRPLTLVGWSLGGIFARDIARRAPESVRQVITLGSPFRLEHNGQSRATRVFDRYAHLHVEHRTLPLESEATPLPVPSTSIYSHFDGIVHWRTCLDLPGERCENIAVMASHLGLGHHPAAIWAIADRLAQPEGTWKPFKAPLFLRPAFPRPAQPATPSSPATAADTAA